MPISKMLKVRIIAHSDRKEELINTLKNLELVQIRSLKDKLESPLWSKVVREEEPESTSELDSQIASIRYALEFINRFETTTQNLIESFFSPKIIIDELDYEKAVEKFDFGIIERCKKLDAQLTRIKNEEASLSSLYEELLPWEFLSIPLEDLETPHTEIWLGSIPVEKVEVLGEITNEYPHTYISVIQETDKVKYMTVVHLKSESDEILKKLRIADFSPVSFENLQGKVTDNLEQLQKKIKETIEEREMVEETCRELLEERLPLMVMHDHLSTIKSEEEVKENFLRTEKAFMLEGWVPRRKVEALREGLSAFNEMEILIEEPDDDEEVPVELRSPGRVMKPFELVTRIYGLPHYREIDPTLALAPFFIVFFGLCLSDVFYGILLILLSFFALKKIKMGPDGTLLFKLLIIAGGVTVVCGFLLGGWFGNLTEYAPGQLVFLETIRQKLTIINPIQNPLSMLSVVLLMGIVHVWFGIMLKLYMNIRDGYLLDALFDQGLWLILIPFGTLMILKTMFEVDIPSYTAVKYVVIGCLVGLVLTQGRYQKGGNIVTSTFKKLFVGLISIYNIFGYLGDVLSYSRVLALGLATGAIAIVFNTILSMVAGFPYVGIILAAIAFPILHLFNLIINALGAFIHPGRLQYVEFFTKFLEGGGEDFKPFQFDSRYVKINNKSKGG